MHFNFITNMLIAFITDTIQSFNVIKHNFMFQKMYFYVTTSPVYMYVFLYSLCWIAKYF